MNKPKPKAAAPKPDALFDRIVTILELARGNVVRAVNTNMVLAYWLIGREIVEEVQGGEGRAEYGEKVVESLSARLTERYGPGFSSTTLLYFRKFYLAYPDRCAGIPRPAGAESGSTQISYPAGRESTGAMISSPMGRKSEPGQKGCPWGAELATAAISSPLGRKSRKEHPSVAISRPVGVKFDGDTEIPHPSGGELVASEILSPPGRESGAVEIGYPMGSESMQGFSPQLSWSHYRALMRVEKREARDFYEGEAIAGGWDKRTLERQIHSFYYERILKSRKPEKMLAEGRNLPATTSSAADELKHPYVLEFLGLPDVAALHESDLERAIITHLQRFLLELGNGFAFVARQKHMRIEEQDRYIDLVFYHCRLKFYLLIDLKVGELTHADVGQMDGYVRMYDGLFTAPGDNPTIGLILCTEKNETVARYSVLNDRKQIFASKYMLCLPTEEHLQLEVEKERRRLEAAREDPAHE